jgi:hypothetical protein
MKKILYADNFRGFSDTYLPLVDVNFLVGENSTGKTSILDLLRIFSNPALFFGPDFVGLAETQFGHFHEIVSAHSANRSYFRIGLIEEGSHAGLTKNPASAMLLTYAEHAGLPRISRFTCSLAGKEINLRFDNGRVLVNVKDLRASATADDMRRLMPEWIATQAAGHIEWPEMSLPTGYPGGQQLPLFVLLSLIPRGDGQPDPAGGIPLMLPSFGPGLVWLAPIRTTARRTYDAPQTPFSSEGSHTPYVIRRMLGSKEEAVKFSTFMAKVGKASGLFQSISIAPFGDMDDPTVPFEVDAVMDDKPLNLKWLGYGVSQALPILVELLDRQHSSWFAIQQPEVHLHPRAQASLGDVFFEMASREGKRFAIETHSDFTIDRFRMNYRRKKASKDDLPVSQILFFERHKKHNIVTALSINANGDLPREQPEAYREFFVREQMKLLGI